MDLWEDSLRRSRERRERVDAQPPFELPARGLSVAAILALAGVSATAVAAGKLWSGGDGGAQVAHAAKRAAIELPRSRAVGEAVDRASGINRPAAPAPAAKARGQTPSVGGTQVSGAEWASSATKQATAIASAAGVKPVARIARNGGGVAELQRQLGVPADGDFGPRTERALKRWQHRHGLTADGIAGAQTRRALGVGSGGVLERKRAARRRSHHRHGSAHRAGRSGGGGVRGLQQALGVGADGAFGPATERALRRWQRGHGLAADGVAGPQTRSRMGLGPGPVLKRKGSHRRASSGGGGSSTIPRVIAAADRIATKPYKYGGGHGSFTDSGYDCSGSVSYALHGGGLLSSPLDSGAFMSYGAPGPGRHITIYANPGHVYMTIDGRRFDTSARNEDGSRWTGTRRGTGGYVVRHPRGF